MTQPLKRPPSENQIITMNHGGGGKETTALIKNIFLGAYGNDILSAQKDGALLPMPEGELVISTDSHVISPLFFPGGDIGTLSVCGTVNDVAMSGATPLYLTVAFILEEGFPLSDLRRVVGSMATAAKACNVQIVTGDTKVVGRGHGDGIFINTTGVGLLPKGRRACIPARIKPGDKILISGTIGDHGMAILAAREEFDFTADLRSDVAGLQDLTARLLEGVPEVSCLTDPTRGGVAAALNELAHETGLGMSLWENSLPIRPAVKAACALLGLDPVHVANEGKMLVFCPANQADQALAALKAHDLGREAAIIGQVETKDKGAGVYALNDFGGSRPIPWLSGEELPRIC